VGDNVTSYTRLVLDLPIDGEGGVCVFFPMSRSNDEGVQLKKEREMYQFSPNSREVDAIRGGHG